MAPLRQGSVAPAPPWFCLIHPTLKPSRTFQIRAQILKKLGNIKSQQEVTQNSKSCPALSGAAPQSRREPASPGVTRCHPWVPGLSEVPRALGRALSMGKAFPTKPSWPRLLPARGAGAGGDISGGGLGDKVSGSIPESLRPPSASPSGSKLGILGADPGCHSLQSQVSPEVPSLIPSRGCLGILWNRGCAHLQRHRKFGNSGLLPALPESHPGLGFPAGNPLAPGDIGTSLSTSPSLPSVSIRSPGFSRSNFPDLQDHPFSILSSCLPCNPCNSSFVLFHCIFD